MSKYVNKVGQLRKGSDKGPLSPYSQNPHQPDYANVSKISTTPEPTGNNPSPEANLLNHPLANPSTTTSANTSIGTSPISPAASGPSHPSHNTSHPSPSTPQRPSQSNSNNNNNNSSSRRSGSGTPRRNIPNIPLPRPVRTQGKGSSNPTGSRMSQSYPKAPNTLNNTNNNMIYNNNNNVINRSNSNTPISEHKSNISNNNNNNINNSTNKSNVLSTKNTISTLPQLSKSSVGGHGGNKSNNIARTMRNIAKDRERMKLANRRSIFDLSLNVNRTKVVSMSAFSYLFCELVGYCQKGIINIAQLEEKLSDIGYSVGTKQLELIIYRNKPGKREIDRIGILEFIQKIVWKRLFQKQADGLEQSMSNKNEFFIIDNSPVTNTFVSVPDALGQFNCASFIGGIIHGILDNAGFPCKVITHETQMEQENTNNGKSGRHNNNNNNNNNNNQDDLANMTKLEKMRTVFIVRFT